MGRSTATRAPSSRSRASSSPPRRSRPLLVRPPRPRAERAARRLLDHNPEPDDERCREAGAATSPETAAPDNIAPSTPSSDHSVSGPSQQPSSPSARPPRRRPRSLEKPPQARRPRAGYVRSYRRPGCRSRRSPIHERFDSVNTPPRRLARQAGLTLFASLLLLGGSVLSSVSWLGTAPAGATSTPPWEPDPGSVGGLVFYNSSGQVVTGGSITDSPIAAYVQGSSTVRTGDTVATLYGYLPVNGQPTSEWSGKLGLTTIFPNASRQPPTRRRCRSRPGRAVTRRCRRSRPTSPTTTTRTTATRGCTSSGSTPTPRTRPRPRSTTRPTSSSVVARGRSSTPLATPTTTTLTALPASPQPFGTKRPSPRRSLHRPRPGRSSSRSTGPTSGTR